MFSRRPNYRDRLPFQTQRVDPAHGSHTGLRSVGRQHYRSWQILVEHRKVGITIRREQFSVTISDTTASREEHLAGYASKPTAIQAARRRIDFILDIQDPHKPRSRRRQARRSNRA